MRAGIWANRGWRALAMPPLALAIIGVSVTFGALHLAQAAPCDEPIVNEIACENSLPGDPESEWEVSGSGSSSIQGFATDISVDQGGTIGFKVDTTASSFRLDIYRMGYYAGNGARQVGTVNPTDVRNQPNCLNAPSTGLIDCGNWTLSATWDVPGDAVSGIYFARLVRTDGSNGASHVFFVVRDDDGQSDLLFQTSDTTWQAYNEYGGNSLYTGSPDGRAYKVSYNRPFTTRDNAPEDWVFNAEYPMVRFLESNGYDVSYTSGIDTDRLGGELLEHDVFVSVGHDEYWSGQQRANVEAARDAGVNLAFFSGNEVYWKTRWEPAIDGSGTPYRTLVSYKETLAGDVIDPETPTWTGTWRDARFSPPADGGFPENALTGTMFRVNCCEIDMVVGAADGDMRFWRNTRVADLTGNQTTTVGSDIVGYEWDADEDNGFRPAGLFRVSETFGGNQEILLDEGDSFGPGSATHSMTMYRAPSGALVFGAGTVQWAWALDSNHDRGSAAADTAAQQAMINLYADMGVQPATLRPGLVPATASSDTTAPTAAITAPADGSNVGPGTTVVVTGTASDVGGRVGGIEVSTDGGTTWHRATGRDNWTYTFTAPTFGEFEIVARATDDSANIGGPSAVVTLTAGGPVTCPCSIWPPTATPDRTDSDTSAVEVGVKFRAAQDGFITGIRFHKSTQNTGTHTGRLWSSTGTLLGTATFTNETGSGWQQALFTSPIAVTANTTYIASYHAPNGRYSVSSNFFGSAGVSNGPLTALEDGVDGGNGVYGYGGSGTFPSSTYQSENYWVDVVFDTSSSDTTAPTVTSRSPASGATGVAVGVPVTATFSEPVTAASVQMSLTPNGGSPVAGSTSYDAASRTATFTPTAALAFGTTYTAAVSGATDAAGNTMTAVNWSFTTAAGDTTAPTITGRSPAIGATGVAVGASVTATFDEAVSGAQVTLTPSGGSPVAGSTSYNAATRTVTFDPTADLVSGTSYTVSVSGAIDAAGNTMSTTAWSFTTATPLGCPCSIWPPTTVPGTPSTSDSSAVELGVKFQAAQDGFITGIRFYKGSANTGTHTGRLWSSTGTLLGTATFTNETGSGWQQALFTAPIAVTANTTYVASYHAPSGRYALQANGLGSAVTNGPLTALASGASGGNGVYAYGGAGQFPSNSWNASNYWVDVVYDSSATDTSPPTIVSQAPLPDASGTSVSSPVMATFSEPVVGSNIQIALTPTGGSAVAGTQSYDAATRTVTFTPAAELQYTTTYTVDLSGVADTAGNPMANAQWSFTTGGPPPPLPTEGPGGPIGVVTSGADPFSGYFAEILRAEGLNSFTTLDITEVDAAELTNYTTVILGHLSVTPQQAATFTSWVQAGGNLIASRPDADLVSLLGLTSAGGTLSEGYIAVNNATGAGAGIESETMQYHGTADRYTLSGATSIATLYSSANVATANPAVTVRNVGSNGGQAAAFTYDLARSIVYTRQGNPAWEGQERDGDPDNVIRSNDLFFGGSEPDWVNLDKVAIPQADEQQRLLANLIQVVNGDRMPLPRTWYFPGDNRAVVVATGDDHANGGTSGRFDTYLAADPAGCSASTWECYRFSSYVYPSSPLSNSAASAYHAQDFEIGLHPANGCENFTPTNLRTTYASELADWASDYPSLPSPASNRFHCLVWSDWASQFEVESENGMRFDVNYYYWPGSWIDNRPGFMTGSGMPQRFAGLDGSMVDVYQAATQMTDESGQSYPFTPNTLLDRALGADGYYGYFVANMHTDDPSTQQDTAMLSSAIARGVPVVSARDALEFIDGRNASSFQNLSWASNTLAFTVVVGTGATDLTAMLPTAGPNGTVLSGITRGGSGVPYQVSTIKGIEYAMFPAAAGSHAATYAAPGGALQVQSSSFFDERIDATSVSWTTDQPTSGTLLLGASPNALSTAITSGGSAGEHAVEVPGLEPGGTYYYRIVSEGVGGTTTTWPQRSQPPVEIVVPEADTEGPTIDGLAIAPHADGTALFTWTTDETADGRVVIRNLDDGDVGEAIGVGGLTDHTVVVTGLEPGGHYLAEVTSTDAAGNSSRTFSRVFVASGAGVAEYMAASQRVGELAGTAIVEDNFGVGHIRLTEGSGTGTFTSRVLDARQMAAWDSARWDTTGDVQVVVSVRGGNSEEPDSDWSEWQVVDRSGGSIDIDSRFVQYRIEFRGGTGSVDAVSITHVGGFASAHGEHQGHDTSPAAGLRAPKLAGAGGSHVVVR